MPFRRSSGMRPQPPPIEVPSSKGNHQQMPGAFMATGRPVGHLPAWGRSSPTNSSCTTAERSPQSDIPPEMRIIEPFSVQPSSPNTLESNVGQSLPSEVVETRRISSFTGDLCSMFAGEANVSSKNDLENKKFRKEVWAVSCFLLLLVSTGIVVTVLLTSRDGKERNSSSPSAMPRNDVPIVESPRLKAFREDLRHLSPDSSVLDDPTTPQYSALQWLADIDEGLDESPPLDRLEARFALATLYYATSGENWFEQFRFLSSEHECRWTPHPNINPVRSRPGVSCDGRRQVFSLNLSQNGLVGIIPPELNALSSLRYLDLSSNVIRTTEGQIPAFNASETMNNIAEFGGGLTYLDLSNNLLETTIPTSFGRLSSLEYLFLGENRLISTVPSELSLLTSLIRLDLHQNKLTGTIEDVFEDLPRLDILVAGSNDFIISPDLRFPVTLTELQLDKNRFDGSPLTSNIGRLSNLKILSLARMNLEGTLPSELGLMTGLQHLILERNHLSGSFIWSSVNTASLLLLDFAGCGLTGQIPLDIGRFTALNRLSIESNFLNGTIPESIGELSELQSFSAGFNLLEGTIPSTIGQMTSLRTLRVQFNSLSGTLPTEMNNMVELGQVTLHGNEFSEGNLEFICSGDREFRNSLIDCSENIVCSCCSCA